VGGEVTQQIPHLFPYFLIISVLPQLSGQSIPAPPPHSPADVPLPPLLPLPPSLAFSAFCPAFVARKEIKVALRILLSPRIMNAFILCLCAIIATLFYVVSAHLSLRSCVIFQCLRGVLLCLQAFSDSRTQTFRPSDIWTLKPFIPARESPSPPPDNRAGA
jgi:hypothetical protein